MLWHSWDMKTTVEIPEVLFRQVKQHCSENGISFKTLLETGLRTVLEPPKPTTQFRLKPFGFKGEGQLIQDWNSIREMAYEGRGGVPSASEMASDMASDTE